MLFDGGQSELYDNGLLFYNNYQEQIKLFEELNGDKAA